MNEHSFSAKILKKCRELGIAKAWKINDDFQGGVPDAWFLGTKHDIWVEFKWLKDFPKRNTTLIKPNLSAQQLDWLITLQEHGKHAICVIGIGKLALVLPSKHDWTHGVTAKEAKESAMTHIELVTTIAKKCGL